MARIISEGHELSRWAARVGGLVDMRFAAVEHQGAVDVSQPIDDSVERPMARFQPGPDGSRHQSGTVHRRPAPTPVPSVANSQNHTFRGPGAPNR